MRIIFFDTETTGIPLWHEPSDDPRQPHIVELAVEVWENGEPQGVFHSIVDPGIEIPDDVAQIHGITTEIARAQGCAPAKAWNQFQAMLAGADLIVGHNVSFDVRLMRILGTRVTGEKWDNPIPTFCTMRRSTNICQILARQPRHARDWKWPTLAEAHNHFFGEPHTDAHSAKADCAAARRIYFHLVAMENVNAAA